MRKDYQPYFQPLCASLTRLGYVSVRERELDAEFTLYSGWKLNFEGEPYYGPMFAILPCFEDVPEGNSPRLN